MDDNNQQPGYYPNQQYNTNQPYPQQPPPQPQYPNSAQWPHMTLGQWLVTMLLMLIPIANIVLVFMWAFGSNVNPSKKSYFQAMLIWVAIGVVLGILIGIAFGALIYSLFSNAVYSW